MFESAGRGERKKEFAVTFRLNKTHHSAGVSASLSHLSPPPHPETNTNPLFFSRQCREAPAGHRCCFTSPSEIDAHCISASFPPTLPHRHTDENTRVGSVFLEPSCLTVSTLPSTAVASVCTGGGCSPLAPSDAIFVL